MIQALAADSYSTRAQARRALYLLGRPAIEPLERATQADDPEVRLRATEILISLRGRGFIGIGLQETEPQEEAAADGAEAARIVTQPVVMATQIVAAEQYKDYGVKKPFPAETAGIQGGDRILAVNDHPVHSVNDLKREVTLIGPARVALLLVERGGKCMRLPLILTRNPILSKDFDPEFMKRREPPPPVDLEKELEQPPAQAKQT